MPALAHWLATHTEAQAEKLKTLITAQRWDDETDTIRHRSLVLECDLGRGDEPFSLDSLPDRRPPRLTGLVGLNRVWSAREVRFEPAVGRPCPACGTEPGGTDRRRLAERGVCCVCSASGSDPRQAPNAPPPPARPGRKGRLAGGSGRVHRTGQKARVTA